MPALPATNRLAALQRNVLVAVAALVVHCARVDVDLLLRFGGVGAAVAAVLLCGHSERCVVVAVVVLCDLRSDQR